MEEIHKEFDLQISEFIKALDDLDKDFVEQIYKSVVVKGLNEVIKPELVNKAPTSLWEERKGVVNIIKPKQLVRIKYDKQDKSYYIGFSRKAYPLIFLEFGTALRWTKTYLLKRKDEFRGKMDPKPFIYNTYNTKVPELITWFNENFGEKINEYLIKKNKKMKKK